MNRVINLLLSICIIFELVACKSTTPEERFIANVKKSFIEKIEYFQDLEGNKEQYKDPIKYYIKNIHKIDKKNIGSDSDYDFSDNQMDMIANLYFLGMKADDIVEMHAFIDEAIYQIHLNYGFDVDSKYKEELKAIKKAEKYNLKICYIAAWAIQLKRDTYEIDSLNDCSTENNLNYYGINIKNPTPVDVSNLKIQYTFYNKDSSTIFQYEETIGEFEEGEEKMLSLKYNKNMGTFKYVKLKMTGYYQYGKEINQIRQKIIDKSSTKIHMI